MKTRNSIGAVLGLVGLLVGCATQNFSRYEVNPKKETPVAKMREFYGCVGTGISDAKHSFIREMEARESAREDFYFNCMGYPKNKWTRILHGLKLTGIATVYNPEENIAVAYCAEADNDCEN